jgi:hypothetical protein
MENYQANTDSYTYGFGMTYTNDTGLDGKTFFTGSEDCTVREIEIFEIIDYPEVSANWTFGIETMSCQMLNLPTILTMRELLSQLKDKWHISSEMIKIQSITSFRMNVR